MQCNMTNAQLPHRETHLLSVPYVSPAVRPLGRRPFLYAVPSHAACMSAHLCVRSASSDTSLFFFFAPQLSLVSSFGAERPRLLPQRRAQRARDGGAPLPPSPSRLHTPGTHPVHPSPTPAIPLTWHTKRASAFAALDAITGWQGLPAVSRRRAPARGGVPSPPCPGARCASRSRAPRSRSSSRATAPPPPRASSTGSPAISR